MKVTKEVKRQLDRIILSLEEQASTAIDSAVKWNRCARDLREKVDDMEVVDD